MAPRKWLRSLMGGLVLAVLLVSGAAAGSNVGKVTEADWMQGAPIDYREANALVIFDHCSLIVSLDGIEIVRHVRKKALTQAGAEAIGTAEFRHHKEDVIKDLEAVTVQPNGTIEKVLKSAMLVKSDDDWRTTTFAFPNVDSGTVIEYRYRNLNTRFHHLSPWYFTNDIYTLESRFTLVLYPGFTYSSAYTNLKASETEGVMTESFAPGDFKKRLKTFTWTKKNIVPLADEPLMGAEENYRSALVCQLVEYADANVNYSYISNWTELGETFQENLKSYLRGGDIEKTAREIIGDATTQQEKARRLYTYVLNHGETKIDPNGWYWYNKSLGDLVKLQSGTAEEKNIWLCELCKAAGLQAWPVLIATRNVRKFNPQIYQLNQFNYLITFVQFDSGFVFMDARSRYCPYGLLPANSCVEAGFLIDGKASEIIRVIPPASRNYRLDATTIDIGEDNIARCSTVCSFTGLFAPQWGALFEEGDPEEIIKERFINRIDDGATIDTFSYVIDSLGRLTLTMVYNSANLARTLDNNLAVKPAVYPYRENPFTASRRFVAIDFDFPFSVHSVTTIRSARPINLPTLPQTTVNDMPGGRFVRQCVFRDGMVTVESKLDLTQAMFPPSSYKEIKDFFDVVARAHQDEVILSW